MVHLLEIIAAFIIAASTIAFGIGAYKDAQDGLNEMNKNRKESILKKDHSKRKFTASHNK